MLRHVLLDNQVILFMKCIIKLLLDCNFKHTCVEKSKISRPYSVDSKMSFVSISRLTGVILSKNIRISLRLR